MKSRCSTKLRTYRELSPRTLPADHNPPLPRQHGIVPLGGYALIPREPVSESALFAAADFKLGMASGIFSLVFTVEYGDLTIPFGQNVKALTSRQKAVDALKITVTLDKRERIYPITRG